MGLFPKAIACLQLGSENLKKILKIIESYLILDSVGIMQVRTSGIGLMVEIRDFPLCWICRDYG